MAEQAVVAEQASEEAQTEQPTETVDATGTEQKADATTPTPKTFTQEDVDRIVGERLQRAQAKAEQATQKAREEAERKAAEEQGKFKELYEKALADAKAAEEGRKALELSTLKASVARAVGLPEKLAARLQGEDEESLTADAKEILATLPKPAAPNINSGAGNGSVPNPGALTDAQKTELAAVYGVNPAYIQ